MKKVINVTQHDIDYGNRCASMSCPVARAFGRHIRKEYKYSVGPSSATILTNNGVRVLHRCLLPGLVQDFIWKFDDCAHVKPFSFLLEIPVEYLKHAS